LDRVNRVIWLYIVTLGVVPIALSLLDLGNYLFFIATPVIDFLWIYGYSTRDYLDRFASIIPLVILYFIVAYPYFFYVGVFNLIRVLLDAWDLAPQVFLLDYYFRVLIGWLIYYGH